MSKSLTNQLRQLQFKAANHYERPDDLISELTRVCRPYFNVAKCYDGFGLITNQAVEEALNDNLIAANRQHDLGAAEAFREQKNSMNPLHRYFIETVHGCHTAPTFAPVTFQVVIDLIKLIKGAFKK